MKGKRQESRNSREFSTREELGSVDEVGENRQETKIPQEKNTLEDLYDDEETVKKWYDDLPKDPEDFKPCTDELIEQLRSEAVVILENDTVHYKNKCLHGPQKSNNEWLLTMMTKGTSRDRIAAGVLLVQNSPVHSLHILKNLIGLVKTAKKECVKAIEVLTDLFTSDLLRPGKKLREFKKCPLTALETLSEGKAVRRKNCLMLWYFEDKLKKEYTNFIMALKVVAQDTVETNREKCIVAMQKLLCANPEQEVLLLSLLANKLGDPIPKIAAKAAYHLTKVVDEHPNMKVVVAKEVEKLLFRPNISSRTQFYGLCFLSQLLFDVEDEDLASKLIDLYFSFFKACIKKGEVDSRMMRAVLTGVKRAFPYAKKEAGLIKEHIETMYKLVHVAQFNIGVHAMCLLFQICDHDASISDRFYSVLYQKLLDPDLATSSLHPIIISLIFRSLCKDLQVNRIKRFVKRLLQICHYVPVPLVCAILIMLSHLFQKNKALVSLNVTATVYKAEQEENDGDEHYEDVVLKEGEEDYNCVKNCEISTSYNGISIIKEEIEKKPVIPTWYHVNLNAEADHKQKKVLKKYSRNPLFGDDFLVYTELVSLATHYHPTVSLFASRLLEEAFIEYTGDPLEDFTLTRFLDRWVFKNPKKHYKKQGSRLSKQMISPGIKLLAINSEEYLSTPENLIPPEELFMYRFMKERQSEEETVKKDDDDDSDTSSVASDQFDAIMDQLIGGKESFDFADVISRIEQNPKKQKKKKGKSDDSDDDDEDDDMSDDEEGDDIMSNDEDNEDEIDEEILEDESASDSGENNATHEELNSDDDMDFSKLKEEFSDIDEDVDDDDELFEFGSDGDEDFEFTMSDVERDEEERVHKQTKSTLKDTKKKMKNRFDNRLFAPAEEFAELLEETGDQMTELGHLVNYSNKDKAGVKQLKWEMSRDNWIKGKIQKRKSTGKSKQVQKKSRRK